jgi:hypothetical protein
MQSDIADIQVRLDVLEDKLHPHAYITDQQTANVANAVKALAEMLTRQKGKNKYQAYSPNCTAASACRATNTFARSSMTPCWPFWRTGMPLRRRAASGRRTPVMSSVTDTPAKQRRAIHYPELRSERKHLWSGNDGRYWG